jgi:Tol biopolymer transport system component
MTDQIAPANKPPLRRSFGSGRLSVAPALSLVGLLIAGLLTAQVYRSWTPTLSSAEATPTPTPVPVKSGQTPTPAPTETIVTNPEISVPGTLVYAKSGNLWVQSGTQARQITQSVNGSLASQPTFTADGQWIYYIDTRITTGKWYNPDNFDSVDSYTLNYPTLCRIHPDGTGRADVLSGLIKRGGLTSFFWIRQPSVLPSGGYVAIVSDGPTGPGTQDTMIHYLNLRTLKLGAALSLRETTPLGLSEPEFSPDGNYLVYTMEGRSGKYGFPSIWIYTGRTNSARILASGYRGASWSPDGKYLAAVRVAGDTLNVVVLNAASGKQVAQVTTDGMSWAPVWSPDGDKLVYMHLTGTSVQLNMVYIAGSGSNLTFKIEPNLTDFTGLDGQSTAAWYIPGFGRAPAPTATPAASGSGAVSSPSASGSPPAPTASATQS